MQVHVKMYSTVHVPIIAVAPVGTKFTATLMVVE